MHLPCKMSYIAYSFLRISTIQRPVNGFRRSGLRWCFHANASFIAFILYQLSDRYEILSDPHTREVYDEAGLEGITGGGGGGRNGMDAADILSELFTNGGFSFSFGGPGMGSRRPGRGEDSIIPYEVSLEDLYNGKQVKMNMERQIVCGSCKGYVISAKGTTLRLRSL